MLFLIGVIETFEIIGFDFIKIEYLISVTFFIITSRLLTFYTCM